MDITIKCANFDDKDRLVVALVNSGYTVSAKWVERKMWDGKARWEVTIHNYEISVPINDTKEE